MGRGSLADRYEEPPSSSIDEARAMIEACEWDRVRVAIVSVALEDENVDEAAGLFAYLAAHEDEYVRGNAVLGFGHLARRFGILDEAAIRPLIEAALLDSSEYVRGQAWAAAEDAVQFLDWDVQGFEIS